jgi:hypothetical protein
MFEIDQNIVTILIVYVGVVLIAFWLAMVIWAYRDMRARSRDSVAQLLVATLVLLLNVPGLFIYILMRPRETLSEAYERSLEEEALLQEIEEKPTCPGCGQRVQANWQACPSCHTRLKKPCHVCRNLLDLSWTLCPHCASSQPQYMPEDNVVNSSRHIQRQASTAPQVPETWLTQQQQPASSPPPATPRKRSSGDAPRYIDEN